MNKILGHLEKAKLVKPVKTVTNKNKKVYMLYDTLPSRDLTGGPWYSDQEFDHEFVDALRNFLLRLIKEVETEKRRGASVTELTEAVATSEAFSVNLGIEEINTVVQVLKYDGLVEEVDAVLNNSGSKEITYKIVNEMPEMEENFRYVADILMTFGAEGPQRF